jgi:hypothetical protein
MSLHHRFSQLAAPSIYRPDIGVPLLWPVELRGFNSAIAIFDPHARRGFALRVRADRADVAFHLDGRIARCLLGGVDHALEEDAESILSSTLPKRAS